jgi:hypothetical protein
MLSRPAQYFVCLLAALWPPDHTRNGSSITRKKCDLPLKKTKKNPKKTQKNKKGKNVTFAPKNKRRKNVTPQVS